MNRDELLLYIARLPQEPGCYLYSNAEGTIIYVGKAKNLRKRVSSYFHKELQHRRTRRLVAQIAEIDYHVVNTEADALILENNLIKLHQPRYNVLLKDNKEYLRIVVTREPFPRFVTSRKSHERGRTFGPFTHQSVAYKLVSLISDIYHLRTCRLNLPPVVAPEKNRFRACLEYDIGRCDAPCIGLIDQQEYLQNVDRAMRLLRGEVSEAIEYEAQQMEVMSARLAFEQAEVHRKRIEMLRTYESKHVVAPNIEHDVDVFSYYLAQGKLFVNMIHLHKGSIQFIQNLSIDKEDDEDLTDLFATGITELMLRSGTSSQEIVLSEPVHWLEGRGEVTIPLRGDKLKLIELSRKNAREYAVDYFTKKRMHSEESDQKYSLVNRMQKDLGLSRPPVKIECFDNSNIQGTSPVSSCVVFKNGKPLKSAYRKFHVKTVVGADDFATMREVVYRRYYRLLEEGQELPDLIIIDGGKGQLRAAYETLKELHLQDKIEIRGLAKRIEELFMPNDPVPLALSRDSQTLKVIQQLRDEAHRFGITFHRQVRSVKQTQTFLKQLPGIGPKTESKLLTRFSSLERVRRASLSDLQQTIGPLSGSKLYSHLHPNLKDGSVEDVRDEEKKIEDQ